jgi:acetyltransferase
MIANASTTPRSSPQAKRRRPIVVAQDERFTSFPDHCRKVGKVHGVEILFRSIAPEDESLLFAFHKTLSDQSVHFRYFGTVTLRQRTMHERLRRHCSIDYTREFGVVAEIPDESGQRQILAVARLFKGPEKDEGEFAILISDAWQGKGLGTYLLKLLVRVGRECHLRRIFGRMLSANGAMTHASRKAGFSLRFSEAEGEWQAEIILQ